MLLKFWCLALLVIMGAESFRPNELQAQERETCFAQWTTRSPNDGVSDVFLDYAEAARWGTSIVGVGDPAIQWNDLKSATPAMIGGVTWAKNGTQSPLPLIVPRIVMYPRAATTTDGRLHVVYGTRTDTAKRSWTSPPDTLWHVVYDGRAWSAPRALPVSSSGPFWWENLSPSALVATGKQLDIAVPIKSRDRFTIALLHWDGHGPWVLRSIATGGMVAAYSRLARVARTLILSWAAPDPQLKDDHGSVFAIRSSDDGRSWSEPQRVHLAGAGTTYDQALAVTSDTSAFLLWMQHSRARLRPADTIGVAMTRDSGRSWKTLPPLSIPDGFDNLRAVSTAWGPLVLYHDYRTSGYQAALLRRGHWVTGILRNGAVPFSGLAVTPLSDTSIVLIGGQKADPPTSLKPATQPRRVSRLVELALYCH